MEHVLIGEHPSIKKIRELVTMVSDISYSVLLTGETGTGKEVVARLLHQASPRKKERFVKVNCAALPGTLLESELFGYEKGAFTGADKQKPGKFELASSGVIFLDEIGDMPLLLQMKLLHVLQSNQFSRLGGTEDVTVDAWVISSTHHDLDKDMKEGLFREDLYYRLNIIKIDLPPLRERVEDIPILTAYFIDRHRNHLKHEGNFSVPQDHVDLFQEYHWPGNVRELSSTILRLMVGDDPDRVKSELLKTMRADGLPLPVGPIAELSKQGAAKKEGGGTAIAPARSLKEVKAGAAESIEKRVIMNALSMSGWNKRKAAKMLKISYKSLFNKINDLDIGK
jgi:transcriptional regulator with PAS, ATPase and Fis domain